MPAPASLMMHPYPIQHILPSLINNMQQLATIYIHDESKQILRNNLQRHQQAQAHPHCPRSALLRTDAQYFSSYSCTLPKKIKEFNAEPYLFIFDAMLRKKELIEFTLSSLAAMLEESYITYPMYSRLAQSLSPLMRDYSYAAVQVISRIREPHLDFFHLYFEVHSNVALPEDLLRKFKTLGYSWLIRAFAMIKKDIPEFEAGVYSKFYPEEMPKLIDFQGEHREIQNYVSLMVGQVVDQIEQAMEGSKTKKGKYGLCFICKKVADYYCKDTKVPVCGVQCKKSHLELLSKTNSLNYQYSPSFRAEIQKLLVSNLHRKQSPALSIDFLVAIYTFSDYVPQANLHHSKVMTLPVIYERIWMLYLSYYSKKEQFCEHILASCLTLDENFVRNMATEYFLSLAADPRFIQVYQSFDRCGEIRLTDYLLRTFEQGRKGQLVQNLIGTLFNSYAPNSHIHEFTQLSHIRSFNHDKVLSLEALTAIFGDRPHEKLIALIFRNELSINRQKLGEYLYQNEDVLRLFLKQIVNRKRKAPIDELLREIFYFINVKISDKIYRLFEILNEVYEPEHPFNEMNFFTYAYFIIMIVTQLNNNAISTKPTLASVLTRVEQFSADLAKNHKEVVQGMFQRISNYSFSQQSRGILTVYQPVRKGRGSTVRPEDILIENNQLIYEIVIASNPDVVMLYRICSLVVNHPAICQMFLQLLVDKLPEEPRDSFLIQAISIIIEQQPNAAGYLWRQILEDIPINAHTFSYSVIVESTARLTDGNFKQFVREFCQMCPMTAHMDHFIKLFAINKSRVSLVVSLLVANYEKCENNYLKLTFIKKFGQALEYTLEDSLSQLLIKMIDDMPLLPITESLFVECILSIRFQTINKGHLFWHIIAKKCLELRNEKNVQVLEWYMKKGGGEFYESYLIQKTLNCCQEEYISHQILKNLEKLQPYIHEIKKDLLRLFVFEENLHVIIRYLDYFSRFNKTYQVILEKWGKEPEWASPYAEDITLSILQVLREEADGSILQLSSLPRIIAKIFFESNNSNIVEVVRIYQKRMVFDVKEMTLDTIQLMLMRVTHFNIFIEETYSEQKRALAKMKEERSRVAQSRDKLGQLVSTLYQMHSEARQFQTNLALRAEIKRLLRSVKPPGTMPSLLNSSILILKAIYEIQDLLQHPNEPSLMRIFSEVEQVIHRQSELSQLPSGPLKKESFEQLCLSEANKDAMGYGQMAIELSSLYLQEKGGLSTGDKATMKRMLISILIQGSFNEQSCTFQSLGGSGLAKKIQHLFHLIK